MNPKQVYGDKKVPLQLMIPAAEIYTCLALREGAIKYGAWNFRENDIELMTYIGAMRRHLNAIVDGEWIDPSYECEVQGKTIVIPEKPHLAGVLASGAILADSYERSTVIDNRPKTGSAPRLLKRYIL